MQRYVDGFLIPLARDKVEAYREIAQKAGQVWKELGALEYYECLGDDLEPQHEMVSFMQSAGAKADETVVFSWIVYSSKEHRDQVNAAVMDDPRMKEMMASGPGPFDFRRMAYGGFTTLVIA